ncbi:NADH-quinone oxidoreductase subunit L [Acidiferrimicrobium sp. IK]|uniref:NADH-quinone oxidoreductase subunit L n=1 Tax=Acidiferrimicrobium sp. IK TaxID=2871700 RepID=UPI0021CB4633|nr:NADH-quinone oxidoreductase subunit L [Acidiferrimicrobium sp. IK]MCU4183173.1 NADH-quinone oxidoreductase subunit L [Acidiferrimicrobium sp. IK]
MNAAYIVLALPLAGALLLVFGGKRLGDPLAGWLATILSFGSFAAVLVTWLTLLGDNAAGNGRLIEKNIFTWLPVAGLHVNFALRIDPLSMTMALFVTGVGSLIHLYSIGYMRGDRDYPRFFFLLNLFLASMIVLVMANSYLFSFVGWEGVGFCSYGLVGFWFDRESAAVAAKKAFVTNRVGDFGFMVALFLMFNHFGSFNYSTVLGTASSGLLGGHATLNGTFATGLGLMIFLGAAGKSAQIPLYMWLPDAMEGPTPVSALIHAATMVTAGVYLVARSAPILHFSHSSQWVIACIGAATMFFAATIACAQNDIKRVLAYSTLSQLGYMFMAEGAGDYTSGLYHMINHAFFKALLFLGAGSVIHALHDEQDMKKMGALRKYLPITFPTFIIGYLALSGIPPFDGFWSKDDILASAYHMNFFLWLAGAVTAGLTAYYMSRQVALVWFGKARWSEARGDSAHAAVGNDPAAEGSTVAPGGTGTEEAAHAPHEGAHGEHSGRPHESPPVMTLPLIILAVLSTIGWLINANFGGFNHLEKFLEPVFPTAIAPAIHVATNTKWVLGIITTALAFIGLFAGLRTWRKVEVPALEPAFLAHGWYIDEALAATVSGPIESGADAMAYELDARGVDGAVNGVASLITGTGRQLRRVQTGYVRNYALGLAGGLAVILAYVAARVGGA